MINFKPLNDRILIRVLPEKETMKNGFYIPDVAKEKPMEGDVVAVSDGYYIDQDLHVLPVVVGDKVYFGKYSGTEIELEGDKFLILKEDEVLGKETK